MMTALKDSPEIFPALVGRIEIDIGHAPLPRPAVATEQFRSVCAGELHAELCDRKVTLGRDLLNGSCGTLTDDDSHIERLAPDITADDLDCAIQALIENVSAIDGR